MIGLLQRVSQASVSVGPSEVARIGRGLLVLVGMQQGDSESQAQRLLERILGYRVFADVQGRLNRSLKDIQGGLLLVPQFTLAADTKSGSRAGFSTAAEPPRAQQLFDALLVAARATHGEVGCGIFGADMQVTLTNDGPVTFILET